MADSDLAVKWMMSKWEEDTRKIQDEIDKINMSLGKHPEPERKRRRDELTTMLAGMDREYKAKVENLIREERLKEERKENPPAKLSWDAIGDIIRAL